LRNNRFINNSDLKLKVGIIKMTGLYYEKKNFENLFHFYSEQLRRIMRGSSAYSVLNARQRQKLVDAGILHLSLDGKRIKNKKRLVLTLRAETMLKKIPKNNHCARVRR
jgi:hypothetical protein